MRSLKLSLIYCTWLLCRPVLAEGEAKFVNSSGLKLEFYLAPGPERLGVAAMHLFDSNSEGEALAMVGLDLAEPLTQSLLPVPSGKTVQFSMEVSQPEPKEIFYVVQLQGDPTGEQFWIYLSHKIGQTETLTAIDSELWYDRPYQLRAIAENHLELEPAAVERGLRRKRPRWLDSSRPESSAAPAWEWCVIL